MQLKPNQFQPKKKNGEKEKNKTREYEANKKKIND